MMGRHVIVALLGAARPEGWEFTERLLLAAQRQEGLRQSILESARRGAPGRLRPDARRHPRQQAAAVRRRRPRGRAYGSASTPTSRRSRWSSSGCARSRPTGPSEAQRSAALALATRGTSTSRCCAGGMRDVTATIARPRRSPTAPDGRPARGRGPLRRGDRRWPAAQELITAAVDDPDIRVAALAAALLTGTALRRPGTFDALARLANRLPATDREAPASASSRRRSRSPGPRRRPRRAASATAPSPTCCPGSRAMDSGGPREVAPLIAGDACRRPRRAGPRAARRRSARWSSACSPTAARACAASRSRRSRRRASTRPRRRPSRRC